MDPKIRHELAYTLLIELLSYQFCTPVRWIETQDAILAKQQAERVIEVGPSNTLTSMLQKTLVAKYMDGDTARGARRELLCLKTETDQIYYAYHPPEPEEAPDHKSSSPIPHPTPEPSVIDPLPAKVTSPPTVTAIGSVPDVPITAAEIISAIVAVALKKSIEEIKSSSSIRNLSAGRSTLQNEIIGDLSKEFDSVPQGAEDLTLLELSAVMQTVFRGQLGAKTRTMTEHMVSTKMAGAFNMRAVKDYLASKWYLGPGRRDGILVLAMTGQPSTRIASEDGTKSFIDSVVEKYFTIHNLSLPSSSIDSSHDTGPSSAQQKALLDQIEKSRYSHHTRLLQLHANELNHDLRASDKKFIEQTKVVENLRTELDEWNAEHGQDYSEGIRSMFNPLKVRQYDSTWNWALQDVLVLFYGILNDTLKVDSLEWEDLALRIINRADSRVAETIRYFFGKLLSRAYLSHHVLDFTQALLRDVDVHLKSAPIFQAVPYPTAPCTIIEPLGAVKYIEVARSLPLASSCLRPNKIPTTKSTETSEDRLDSVQLNGNNHLSIPAPQLEYVGFTHDSGSLEIQVREGSSWIRNEMITSTYLKTLGSLRTKGLSFERKNFLITGTGEGSLGAKIIEGLLEGGANIVVTTSSYTKDKVRTYEKLYRSFGSRGSRLVVLPFNQGSQRDVDKLISYTYDSKDGLGWDLDCIIPFAAISENGHQIDELDSRTELAHRLMLTNTLRLLGAVKKMKSERGITSRPAQVILPLSPNHGLLGNDGLYSESKLGLEGIFGKWHSEDWADYLSICGAIIGWTRGTNLMESSDIISEGVELAGIRTFSKEEMAFNIIGLMAEPIRQVCQSEPIKADLSGNMAAITNLKKEMTQIRRRIKEISEIRRAIAEEERLDRKTVSGENEPMFGDLHVQHRSNITLEFPRLPDYKHEIEPLGTYLKGMVDLDKIVVVAGFAEVGPYGNSRTRWEMEAFGKFSVQGCIEMAWIMKLVKHHHGIIQGKEYSGWIETASGQPISDLDIKLKYENHILDHSGIRLIDTTSDSRGREYLHEVLVQADLDPFEASKDVAEQMRREHGDKVDLLPMTDSEYFLVFIKRGARLLVPKAMAEAPRVLGTLPSGWDPKTYGIDDSIISQVDPVTLMALVCTVEALLSAGITDAFEIYQYIHVSELGSCLGSGVGGAASTSKIYKDRLLDRDVQNDILQESFVNTTGAWINMLLLSSSGAIKTPVGACATALESLDAGYELIVGGKAKMCLVGGYDDSLVEVSDEFRNMRATIDVTSELARGRTPGEMSRPAATTRNGFVESSGSGIQLLATASVALEMGLPIHGIIALTTTASDKIGRSVPGPGKGLLTVVRETPDPYIPLSVNIRHRKKRLDMRRTQLLEQRGLDMEQIQMITKSKEVYKSAALDAEVERMRKQIDLDYVRELKKAQNEYGNEFYKDDARISPMRGALAVWGLTVDDINVASFHGTSTVMSEKNESDVIHRQMEQLGRQRGNPVLGVFQKHLTGHPKGAAGAWMLNGGLQILDSGLVPGNRNLDNVDEALKQYHHIVFPSESIQTNGVKAFSVTSFGFGQKGAQAIGVHPKYLFATLEEETYVAYQTKVEARQKVAYRYFHDALVSNKMFVAKDKPPYSVTEEGAYLMNPGARLGGVNEVNSRIRV
ncbi:Fatty acid synthase subunit alpha 7 [Phlyctema vagabunda]|uniref:beta-ketoacyl-[acyl-carrier-protein] synthase I n=1 Tax=Phlyctema vagabunda TaxID=108571 RepID=A0ABR4PB42_9HELO